MLNNRGSDSTGTAPHSPDAVRRRQNILLIAGLGGVLVTVLCMVLLTNNGGEATANTGDKKDEIRRTAINLPSNNLSTNEIWIEKSETELKKQTKLIETMQNKLTEMEKKLQIYESEDDKKFENLKKQLDQDAKKDKGSETFGGLPIAPFGGKTKTVVANDAQPTESGAGVLSNLPPPPKGSNMLALNKDSKSSSSKATGALGATPSATAGDAESLPPVNMAEKGIIIVHLDESKDGKAVAKPGESKPAAKNAANYLPAGSFTQAVLLSGLDAPTGNQAQSNPMPVLFKLSKNSILPNRWRSKTKECLVTGAGFGDLSSERAYVRTEMLSCVLLDGTVVETQIDGFVSGEDGKAGMRGDVISKQGQAIGYAALAGLFSGFGAAANDSLGTTSVSPLGSTKTLDTDEVWSSGALTGFATGMDRISQFYVDMANRLFPIVEVPAGRTVTLVLTKGSDFGSDVDINDTGEAGSDHYPRNRDSLASVGKGMAK